MHFSTVAAGLAMMSTTGMAQYVLEDDYFSGNFFDKFSFFTSGDPTHGFVQYQSEQNSQSQNLINSTSNNAYIGVDHTNAAPNGRNSVRLTSTKAYDTGLIIIDLEHMPVGCGTWPAFWMVGADWPVNGEIDIIEGVHDQTTNDMTLHTNPGCTITNNGAFTGSISTSNCDINAAGQGTNQGCGITTTNTNTYGNGFNANGGGIYATEITADTISIYFFEHSSAPSDIHSSNPNPANWGKPLAQYQGGCDIAEHFKGMQLVFDTTFCGDWAGAVWGNFATCSAKASSCTAFVQDNPSAFADAYWSVNSLKVYSAGSGWSESSAATTTAPSTTAVPTTAATTSSAVVVSESEVAPAPTTSSTTSEVTIPTSTAVIINESNVAPAPQRTTFAISTRSETDDGPHFTRSVFAGKNGAAPTILTEAMTSTSTSSSSIYVQTATAGWVWDGGAFTYGVKREAAADANAEPESEPEPKQLLSHHREHQHDRHQHFHKRHHGAGRL